MATKPAKKASVKSAKPQNALQKPQQPSAELAAIIGSDPVSRGEVTSKVWDYIKSHNLQNPENRREILADDKLRKVFGKDKVTMFEMQVPQPAPQVRHCGQARMNTVPESIGPVVFRQYRVHGCFRACGRGCRHRHHAPCRRAADVRETILPMSC